MMAPCSEGQRGLDIQGKVEQIIRERLGKESPVNRAQAFFSGLQLEAMDLVYLCVLAEKVFDIEFHEEDYLAEGFFDMEGFCKIIAAKL